MDNKDFFVSEGSWYFNDFYKCINLFDTPLEILQTYTDANEAFASNPENNIDDCEHIIGDECMNYSGKDFIVFKAIEIGGEYKDENGNDLNGYITNVSFRAFKIVEGYIKK